MPVSLLPPLLRRAPAALCLLALTLCLSGCLGLQFGGGSRMPPPSIPLVGEARSAWDAGDMRRAESLYARVRVAPGITAGEQREAWERSALAANGAGRPGAALGTLEKWRTATPGADSLAVWQDAWLRCILTLAPTDGIARARTLWKNKKYSDGARHMAGILLLGRSWDAASAAKALPFLGTAYAREQRPRRAALERALAAELRYMALPVLQLMAKDIGADRERAYPWSVLLLEQARREGLMSGGDAAPLLARIGAPGVFADPDLVETTLGRKISAPAGDAAKAAPAQSVCLVLALPTSGAYSAVAEKIVNGAQAARQELARNGTSVDVKSVNTNLPDWLDQINALPPSCVVVGGPLQAKTYNAAKAGGLAAGRVLFAFLPQVGAGEEGVRVWRFFPSPDDQVNALLRFARQELGITSYASFYPADAYGPRMSSIFDRAVRAQGGVLRTESYSVSDPAVGAARLLRPRFVGRTPVPTADFGAVFLPDVWKHMDAVVTGLQSQGEDRLVLLGTALWEQGLAHQSSVNTALFKLAVFPGSWNRAVVPPALQGVGPTDFWVGLGYDFVRFGAAMGLDAPAAPAEVNARIQRAQRMDWAMAPLRWTPAGQGHQDMFLFTPAAGGFERLDIEAFRTRHARVRDNFNERQRQLESAQPAAQPTPQPAP